MKNRFFNVRAPLQKATLLPWELLTQTNLKNTDIPFGRPQGLARVEQATHRYFRGNTFSFSCLRSLSLLALTLWVAYHIRLNWHQSGTKALIIILEWSSDIEKSIFHSSKSLFYPTLQTAVHVVKLIANFCRGLTLFCMGDFFYLFCMGWASEAHPYDLSN